jgi:hypothetical protein
MHNEDISAWSAPCRHPAAAAQLHHELKKLQTLLGVPVGWLPSVDRWAPALFVCVQPMRLRVEVQLATWQVAHALPALLRHA